MGDLFRNPRWNPGGKLINPCPPPPKPLPMVRSFQWLPVHYFGHDNDRLTITSTYLNGGKPFDTPAENISCNAFLLMLVLPMSTGVRPRQQWLLFEPGTQFEKVDYKKHNFSGGYTVQTVGFHRDGFVHVPFLQLGTGINSYPQWETGQSIYGESCITFQYNLPPISVGDYWFFYGCNPGVLYDDELPSSSKLCAV